MTEPIIRAVALTKTFTDADAQLEAVAESSLDVQPNEFVSIIGPSGCGKSTLLRTLGGLVCPTSGQVYFEGEPLTAPLRRIGFVFQHDNLMPWRTALRNVMLPLEISGTPKEEARARAAEMLALVGLDGFGDSWPRELSGGMRQRVALARELVYDPDVLLLDEPFGALDALTREQMNSELLRIWRARRKTVVMVTHDIQEALILSDRVLTMSSRPGRIEKELIVALPRPRNLTLLSSPRFVDYSRQLRASLE